MIEPAKEIIKQIKSIITLSFQKTPRSKSKSSGGSKKKIKNK